MFATEATDENLTGLSKATDSPVMDLLKHPDRFLRRHIGPTPEDAQQMLKALNYENLDDLIDAAVPANIRLNQPLNLPAGRSELASSTSSAPSQRKTKSFAPTSAWAIMTASRRR